MTLKIKVIPQHTGSCAMVLSSFYLLHWSQWVVGKLTNHRSGLAKLRTQWFRPCLDSAWDIFFFLNILRLGVWLLLQSDLSLPRCSDTPGCKICGVTKKFDPRDLLIKQYQAANTIFLSIFFRTNALLGIQMYC